MISSTNLQKLSQANQNKGNLINEKLATKRSKLGNVWSRPLSNLVLKIWTPNIEGGHDKLSIGIGLGTKMKSNMFSFAILDANSIDWFRNTIYESINIRDNYKDESSTNPIIWQKQLILDAIRKIGITVLVKRNDNNLSINLLINSKTFLYTDLSDSDIEWISSTLEIAKYNLSEGAQ